MYQTIRNLTGTDFTQWLIRKSQKMLFRATNMAALQQKLQQHSCSVSFLSLVVAICSLIGQFLLHPSVPTPTYSQTQRNRTHSLDWISLFGNHSVQAVVTRAGLLQVQRWTGSFLTCHQFCPSTRGPDCWGLRPSNTSAATSLTVVQYRGSCKSDTADCVTTCSYLCAGKGHCVRATKPAVNTETPTQYWFLEDTPVNKHIFNCFFIFYCVCVLWNRTEYFHATGTFRAHPASV